MAETKIYEIDFDVNRYQQLVTEKDDAYKNNGLLFEGVSRLKDWKPLETRVYNPQLEEADFPYLTPGALVVGSKPFTSIPEFFEMAGEILPIQCKDNDFRLLNILECVDCLDHDNCKWEVDDETGMEIRILEYAFKEDMLPESSLFKVYRFRRASLFVSEGRKDPEDEFKHVVESAGFTGLKFTQVWES